VVDVLRATTTIATLFERGLERLIAMDDLDAARDEAAARAALLAGEVGGLAPEGFDLGNSPAEVSGRSFESRELVLFTTNGTAALCNLSGRPLVVAGAVANVTAVARVAARERRVAIVCAGEGRGERFALEDLGAAALIAAEIVARTPGVRLGDGAQLALALPDPLLAIRSSRHAGVTARLGLGDDIAFACRRDTASAVPAVAAWGEGRAELVRRGA
jgi:2-phosphosulfolactate phosphatase